MYTAVALLAIPLILRSILDYLPDNAFFNFECNNRSTKEAEIKCNHSVATYNAVFFVFSTYVPIICQFSTFIFGFVRNKQLKGQKENGKTVGAKEEK